MATSTTDPRLKEIRNLAEELIERHLPGWHFGFNRQRRTLGVCRYREQRIELSRHHALAGTRAQARATVLHEIAHGLAGPGTAHGPEWRYWMQHLGETPQVTAQTDYRLNDYRWALVLRQGHDLEWVAGRYRRPQRTDHLALRRRPGTLGQIYYLAFAEWRHWVEGNLPLEKLGLRQ